MRWGSLGVDQRRGVIVLVVLRWVGLGIFDLWNFELVDAGGEHRWSCHFVELALRTVVNLLQFVDVYREVRHVGWDRE